MSRNVRNRFGFGPLGVGGPLRYKRVVMLSDLSRHHMAVINLSFRLFLGPLLLSLLPSKTKAVYGALGPLCIPGAYERPTAAHSPCVCPTHHHQSLFFVDRAQAKIPTWRMENFVLVHFQRVLA